MSVACWGRYNPLPLFKVFITTFPHYILPPFTTTLLVLYSKNKDFYGFRVSKTSIFISITFPSKKCIVKVIWLGTDIYVVNRSLYRHLKRQLQRPLYVVFNSPGAISNTPNKHKILVVNCGIISYHL